ncbi:MAG: hypothetical protein QXM68_03355 [Candidatus Aenigmatarchaeota archaeon]|nr:hypothetical protein [Candidatus Aenigmarchaeota archaeon]
MLGILDTFSMVILPLSVYNIKNGGTRMDIAKEAKNIIKQAVGNEAAEMVNKFSDPKRYPKEFLEDCIYFLAKFVGEDAAREKFAKLYKKYV